MQNDIFSPKSIFYLFLFVVLATTAISSSLYSQYKVDVWTTENGLPQNSANQIIQTQDGYLWIGTYGGLARFDGITFTQISGPPEGFPSNRILALYESRDGGIWIGTEGGGVSKYKDGKFTNYGKNDGLRDDLIYTLCEDSDTILWIGTRLGVQCLRNGKIEPNIFDDKISRVRTRKITLTNSGVLWINTDEGVYRIHQKKLELVLGFNLKDGLVPAFLFEDFDKSNWFRTSQGLLHQTGSKLKYIKKSRGFIDYYITTMMRDFDSTYWFCGMTTGISYTFKNPVNVFTNLPLPDGKLNAKIQTCLVDREGNRWIGTDGDGLIRIKDKIIDIIGKNEGLKHQIIEAVFEDSKNNLWVGTNDGGLHRSSNGRWHNFTLKDGIPGHSIWSLAEDKEGNIWAGSFGSGLFLYKNKKFKNYSTVNGLKDNIVLALYCDRQGKLWIGTENGGVNIYQNGKYKSLTEKDGLSSQNIRTFLEDRNNAIWIGTQGGGLNRYENGNITVYNTDNGLSHNVVRSIYEDADGILWIGTYGGGLNRLKDGKFTHYTTNDGLYDNMVSAILEDEQNNLWMSCNRGVFRAQRNQLNDFAEGRINSIISIAYTTADGLLSDETNGGFQPAAWKMHNGDLLFPTIKGIAVIHPERIKNNTVTPIVHIEQVILNQISLPLAPRIEIPYGRQRIEIKYTALSYYDPEHITFKYKLGNIAEDWVETKHRRSAYLWNLPYGEHVFHVVAAKNNGIWSDKGASIVLVISPPFWKTWYFSISVISLFLLLIYFIYKQREIRQQRIATIQQKFSQQLLSSTEAERKRIASELHDSIGQELLIIKNRALLALNDLKNRKEIKEQLEEISSTASQAIQETREISYNLRPYQIDRLGLTKAVESIIKRAQDISTIVFTSDIDSIDDVIPKEKEIHFFRIIQESINNIIKHSKATTCKITIKRWHDRLNIDIEDNGEGFDLSIGMMERIQGYGIKGIAERARLLDGKAKVESTPGKGTRVLLTFTTNERTNGANKN